MKERPIPFSAPMVRALLAGTKTQTRRLVKTARDPNIGCWMTPGEIALDSSTVQEFVSPYGQPGDRLWVREAWRTADTLDSMSPSAIADKCLDAGYRKPWAPLQWEADGSKNKDWSGFGPGNGVVVGPGKLRPGMFMPRWASRITLEVTDVRVDRLQNISEADSKAEGCEPINTSQHGKVERTLLDLPLLDDKHPYRNGYALLWESINGPASWAANPWVWVVHFNRLEAA